VVVVQHDRLLGVLVPTADRDGENLHGTELLIVVSSWGKVGIRNRRGSVRRRRDDGGTAVGRDTRASETDELTRPHEDGAGRWRAPCSKSCCW
jgi:hypothetical protein